MRAQGIGNVRLFIALWPPDEVRDAMARWQASWQWPERASVVRPERLHMTLHFLGDVAQERIIDLRYVLARVPMTPFALRFVRHEMWQRGVAVLRPESAPTALRALQARIGLTLAQVGLPVEDRSYRPHVTLARRAAGAKPPAEPVDIPWECRSGFVLVQTLPGPRGYEVLERFAL